MIHNLINMSDPYTFETEDLPALTAAVFILGEGRYATESEDTDFSVPITAFGGENGVTFFKRKFEQDFTDYIHNSPLDIAQCLDSLCLGKASDRDTYFGELKKLDNDEAKKAFTEKWYDKRQSSMNSIGQKAASIAAILYQNAEELNKA